jgi:riboflavin kinase
MNDDARVPKVLHIKGRVFSGSGEGARFVRLPWVRKQIKEKLGFVPYLGTLNVKLTADSINLENLLEKAKPIEITPKKGFCRGICFNACLVDDAKCAILIPEVVNYPKDVIEVIAPENLRKKFKLKDGDVVEVKIAL